jgi:hypothetical protein
LRFSAPPPPQTPFQALRDMSRALRADDAAAAAAIVAT